jgi:hypothetical protein
VKPGEAVLALERAFHPKKGYTEPRDEVSFLIQRATRWVSHETGVLDPNEPSGWGQESVATVTTTLQRRTGSANYATVATLRLDEGGDIAGVAVRDEVLWHDALRIHLTLGVPIPGTEPRPADALTQDECDAIGVDGRDGRGWVTESNLTPDQRVHLAAIRSDV